MTPGEAAVEESLRRRGGREGRLEVLGVDLGGARVAHGDRTVAGRRPPAGAPGVAEDALGQLGEVHEVAVLERLAGAAEAGQPVLDVRGVARLAELPVVDDVQARVRLLPDDLRHRAPGAGGESGRVDGNALLAGEHRPDEVLGTRQAAGMRGEEAVRAPFHATSSQAAGIDVVPRRSSWRGKALPEEEGAAARHRPVMGIAARTARRRRGLRWRAALDTAASLARAGRP